MFTYLHLHKWIHRSGQLVKAILLVVSLLFNAAVAQQTPRVHDPSQADPEYDARKLQQAQNQIRAGEGVDPRTTANAVTAVVRPACFEPFNNTPTDGWLQAPRNDDGSFGPVALGWNFSLYGTIYNSVYINTNGNITFNSSLSTFTPNGFPISTPMVAPFWADVDTRNAASGVISYKVFPDRLVVTWDHVGYFNQQVDKTNTFQLVIKANTAPGFTGDDVIFSYDDMQWTTGSASSGVNGFGGAAATVGANRGDNVNFVQTGRFNINSNQPPNVPTTGTPGGIDFLDGQCIGYQVRGSGGNIPPAVVGLPANNILNLAQGETRTLSLQFSGPETNQNVAITTNTSGLCNSTAVTTNNNTPNPTVTFTATGSTCNSGTTNITITAIDNGSPASSQTFTIAVVVAAGPVVNQPPVFNGPLPGQNATTGAGFSYSLPTGAFTDPNGDALTYSASGLPAGLVFSSGVISGTPTVTGVFTVTLTATDSGGLSITGTLVITIGTVPVTPPANQAPEFKLPLVAQTGTVGVSFTYGIPAGTFVDPNGDPLTYSASGLPPGITFSGTTFSGTPTTAGTFNVVIAATDPSLLSATGILLITIGTVPPTPGSFTITGATAINCTTISAGQRMLTFSPQYAGLNGQPVSFSVANELAPTTNAGPYTLQLYTDNPVITLKATQAGTAGEASFSYNWLAACTGTPNPPTPGSFAITGLTGLTCTPITASQRILTFSPLYAGLTGQPITFAVVNELAPTTNAGPYSLQLYTDNPTIVLKATQAGTAGEATFRYDWLAICGSTPIPPTPGSFTITGATTVSCVTTSAGQRMLTFSPQYAGLNGQPVSFSVANELAPTTNAGPYTLQLYTDNPVITLKAMQTGSPVSASFAYSWLAGCTTGSARSAAEPTARLIVSVLGNPVLTEAAEFDVRGAEGESLRMQIIDSRGHSVSEMTINQASAIERVTLRLGRSAGMYLLRVSTADRKQVVKIVKQ